MQRGDWYKAFTASESPIQGTEIYYRIVDIVNEDVLLVDEYTYYMNMKKYIKTTKNPVQHPSKWWLEQNIRNNIYPIERDQVPFILHI